MHTLLVGWAMAMQLLNLHNWLPKRVHTVQYRTVRVFNVSESYFDP